MRFTAQPNLVNRVKKSNELNQQPTSQPISSKVKQDIEPIRSSSSSSNHYETPRETRQQISLSPSSQPASASANKTNPKSQDANFEDNFEYLENPSKKKSPKTKVIVCNCCWKKKLKIKVELSCENWIFKIIWKWPSDPGKGLKASRKKLKDL